MLGSSNSVLAPVSEFIPRFEELMEIIGVSPDSDPCLSRFAQLASGGLLMNSLSVP